MCESFFLQERRGWSGLVDVCKSVPSESHVEFCYPKIDLGLRVNADSYLWCFLSIVLILEFLFFYCWAGENWQILIGLVQATEEFRESLETLHTAVGEFSEGIVSFCE